MTSVRKILYITMSNLGDAMMGLPAFDFLRRECPEAEITVVAGPRTACVFQHHPDVAELIVYDKGASWRSNRDLFLNLKAQRFDVVIDLRDTFFRWALKARHKNPAHLKYPAWAKHSHQKHLLKAVVALHGALPSQEEFDEINSRRNPSFISRQDQIIADQLLAEKGLAPGQDFVLVAPGARSSLKKWHKEGYAQVIREIRQEQGIPVVVLGDEDDRPLIQEIVSASGVDVLTCSESLTFGQLSAFVLRSKLVICNDSGILHVGSYLEKSVIGIYGPSNEGEYGPWSRHSFAVRKQLLCAPCEKTSCRYDRACIKTIRPYDVLLAARLMLEGKAVSLRPARYRRILVSRTDRMGDVLLTTPVLKTLRRYYPTSFIAMMVGEHAKDLLEGNPYVDEVILLDKDKKHKGLRGTLAFSEALRKKGFDLAIILHPTFRVHLICFLAGITERLGYDRKGSFFLTRTVPHTKQQGLKHEVEYNFDLLKYLGIMEIDRELTMPINARCEQAVEEFLRQAGVGAGDRLLALHPTASCLSRCWPTTRFAELADRLSCLPAVKVIVVSDKVYGRMAQQMLRLATRSHIDGIGQFSLSELASLFKRCTLVVSNDSGPVHMAVAVKTPVISIFGRNQPGLGPQRWGPLGAGDVVLHKETDCRICLAHDCRYQFKCLQAITVDEVLGYAEKLLGVSRPSSERRNHSLTSKGG
ncbi:MAG: glycosyltransferase family 9 protein [Candidatus Omnitrophota bacterium]